MVLNLVLYAQRIHLILLCLLVFSCKSISYTKEKNIESFQIDSLSSTVSFNSLINKSLQDLVMNQDRAFNIKIYSPIDSCSTQVRLLAEANYSNKDKFILKENSIDYLNEYMENEDIKHTNSEQIKNIETKKEYNTKTFLERIKRFLFVLCLCATIVFGYSFFQNKSS